jgi:hypothetical protein
MAGRQGAAVAVRGTATDAPGIDHQYAAAILEQRERGGQTGHSCTHDQAIGIAYSLLRCSMNRLLSVTKLSQDKGSEVFVRRSMT